MSRGEVIFVVRGAIGRKSIYGVAGGGASRNSDGGALEGEGLAGEASGYAGKTSVGRGESGTGRNVESHLHGVRRCWLQYWWSW